MRIAELCREAGITQAELADKVGISKVGLSKAINGNPTLDTLERLANGLEVSIVELSEAERMSWIDMSSVWSEIENCS